MPVSCVFWFILVCAIAAIAVREASRREGIADLKPMLAENQALHKFSNRRFTNSKSCSSATVARLVLILS
ncbi:hypothetical protein [Cylindrospermum sp. FACHB-282]|uniref:hypothetical protein n=1 Tax=Cylindrospermum sp. FACHB-282 TaxID=2692794 RepID=UPI001687AA0D|nr:hypothetical protein [Cylindrospermum sp. FACHB-282]MBD2387624.1 hypothetical protein [Cylindrospermum sp. FACHB-282]